MSETVQREGVQFSDFTLYFDVPELCRGKESIARRSNEIQALVELVRNPRQLISSQNLSRAVWGQDKGDEAVEKLISGLRKLLGGRLKATYIETVRKKSRHNNTLGVAYVFRADIQDLTPGLQVEPQRTASVFLSYPETSEGDAARARRYLQNAGIEILEVKYSAEGNIRQLRDDSIGDCDSFLFFHTPESHTDIEVRKDLGVVLTRRSRSLRSPRILVLESTLPTWSNMVTPLTHEGLPLPAHDLTQHRGLRLGPAFEDRLGILIRQVLARITFLGGTEDEYPLFKRSVEVYETLFPDKQERDDPSHIWQWIENEQPQVDGLCAGPWRAIYGIYQIDETVVGVAFISANVDYVYAFGNYIGILRTWRHEKRAEHFVNACMAELKRVAPQTKYVVFEVDPVDFEYLEEIIHKRPEKGPLFGHGDDDRLLMNLRHLKRLHFYSRKHAWTAMNVSTRNPRPAMFRQPALKSPYRQRDERPLFFLMRPLTGDVPGDTSIGAFMNFAYDALYSSAYPFPAGSRELEKALDYVQGVKQRVAPELRRCVFQRLRIPTAMTDLLHRAADEGYREQLIL